MVLLFFFFNDTATTEIYTLSLHDALPISLPGGRWNASLLLLCGERARALPRHARPDRTDSLVRVCTLDRKSTRLNSSHSQISYAVFCLKKKNILKIRCVDVDQHCGLVVAP